MSQNTRSTCRYAAILVAAFYLGTTPSCLIAFEINDKGMAEPDTHRALSIIAARDHHGSLIQDFLNDQLLEPKGLQTIGMVDDDPYSSGADGRITIPLLEALAWGAQDEDSGHYRPGFLAYDEVRRHRMANHFYNPYKHGEGLTDKTGFLQLLAWLNVFSVSSVDCKR